MKCIKVASFHNSKYCNCIIKYLDMHTLEFRALLKVVIIDLALAEGTTFTTAFLHQ